MIALKCKMCGGELKVTEDQSVCECEYCGSKQTVPTIDDEKKMKLYDRANRLRMANEFDKASGVYESIIAESDLEAEAYWGLLLCKYGIEYVDDPVSGAKVPTCHRSSFDSIMEDSDFEMVMENADNISRNLYREQAKQIEEIRKGIIEVSGKEEPYDIFICYKETDENGDRTVDSVMAQNVYDMLTEKGYRVFFSRISLEDKLGWEYEPYIFAALTSAKIMLVFGTSYDNYNAVWVKNEWSRYLKLMVKDKEKHLIPCFKGTDAYDIPNEFKHLQAQDMGKVGADQDLLRGIDKILKLNGAKSGDINVEVSQALSANAGSNINSLLERGFITLEDGEFDKADNLFESVLNQSPKCAEAYMGKILAYCKSKNITELVKLALRRFYDYPRDRYLLGSEEDSWYLSPDILHDYHFIPDDIWSFVLSKLNCDVKDIIQEKYILANQFSDSDIDAVHIAFVIPYLPLYYFNENFDGSKDFVEAFCTLNEMLRAYYARFKEYATDEQKTEILLKEKERYDEIRKEYSKEGLEDILEIANEYVKERLGDEYNQIEKKYQEDLKIWEETEEKKQLAYENECCDIRENWPAIRIERQNAWKTECERLTAEYNQKKAEYDIERNRVDAHNKDVQNAFKHAKDAYDNEINKIDLKIDGLREEIAGLSLLKIKKKNALKKDIDVLESKKKAMLPPVLNSYGKLMALPSELEPLKLPPRPIDSEEPIYPERPIRSYKPKREDVLTDVNGIAVLAGVMNDRGYRGWRLFLSSQYLFLSEKTILFGKDPGGNPIEWIVLQNRGNEMLVFSKNIIDYRPYNPGKLSRDIKWENCDLRRYLNSDFINDTFSKEEQAKIKEVSLQSSGTFDKVFCLNESEVHEFLHDERFLHYAYPTQYVKEKFFPDFPAGFVELESLGCEGSIAGEPRLCTGDWWLREEKYLKADAWCTWSQGDEINRLYQSAVAGVRPALWIKLDS
ncbi:DUF6273 domain-containing protein [Eubacterium xylanophilum]|uniref:DUF6273 domain-containing protein n=1 Tax=Eubacterium xylanophilum TaxID=39497 RepID=UPI00047AC0BD|nr:DUF6273 domain-containing protein [Eubacterium xylanophilum]